MRRADNVDPDPTPARTARQRAFQMVKLTLRQVREQGSTEWMRSCANSALVSLDTIERGEARLQALAERHAPHDPTPLEVLARHLPPLRGGAPEAYQPTPEDWCEYARWSRFHEMVEAIHEAECSTSRLTDEDLLRAGLPVG
jgi:hypothetical protein